MANLHEYVYNMWKEAAERNPASVQPQSQIQKKPNPLFFINEEMGQKNFFKKPTPEEIARRIWNNSRNKRRYL